MNKARMSWFSFSMHNIMVNLEIVKIKALLTVGDGNWRGRAED